MRTDLQKHWGNFQMHTDLANTEWPSGVYWPATSQGDRQVHTDVQLHGMTFKCVLTCNKTE